MKDNATYTGKWSDKKMYWHSLKWDSPKSAKYACCPSAISSWKDPSTLLSLTCGDTRLMTSDAVIMGEGAEMSGKWKTIYRKNMYRCWLSP